jgi:precorrin-6B C5,15-methyltransferase / cobalt-precorrin-6B C5,C15-methyltransferase
MGADRQDSRSAAAKTGILTCGITPITVAAQSRNHTGLSQLLAFAAYHTRTPPGFNVSRLNHPPLPELCTRPMHQWLSIVGIGDDGMAGLSPIGKSLLDQAQIVVGGTRHLAMLPDTDERPHISWTAPIEAAIAALLGHRGSPVCVLASGDPMCYGIGSTLSRRLPIGEITIVPAPSAFSLACARLGWPQTEVEVLSLCGRDPALIHAVLYPGARVLALSADRQTPAIVAQLLADRGYGNTKITVLEHLGGPQERLVTGIAARWQPDESLADLNTIALDCPAAVVQGATQARVPGLPDQAYHHDGQLTKREVRALTLSSLAPLPGQLLWDIGAGCGSISIEWLRSHPRMGAIAVEPHPTRVQMIGANATALGVPNLQIVVGKAPLALEGLPVPDAVFMGGGLTVEGVFEAGWERLRSGGRLVANGVTVETEQRMFALQQQWGGSLSRVAVQRAEPIGQFLGWKALAPITQWVVVKP